MTLAQLAWTRLAFGPTLPELALYLDDGTKSERACFEAFVEAQLHPEAIDDKACDARLAALRLATQSKSVTQLWQDHAVAANKLKDQGKHDEAGALRQQPLHETEKATWVRVVNSRRQLHEVLVDAWHGHFSVFGQEGQVAPVFASYDRDVIRPCVLGNFRDLLGRVAESPAMLFYLDNHVNQSGNPNENYARELFELHTLGAEHYLGTEARTKVQGYGEGKPVGYVDGDVYEAARCFTGWRVDSGGKSGETGVFQYFDAWHDRFQKIVLGHALPEHQPPQKDGRDVLDLLSAHPATARHVALRLCRRLVADDPPASLVDKAARVFRETARAKDQLRSVVRAIVLSDEFARSERQKLRRPLELTVAALRATGAELIPDDDFLKRTGETGQRLFAWHTPDGYPDRREAWDSTAQMLERWRFANQLAHDNVPGARLDVLASTPAGSRTPAQIADHWLPRLLGQPPDPRTRVALVSFLAQGRNPDVALSDEQRRERLPSAVALILMTPELQWR